MENKVENNNTAVAEVKKEKLTLKERLKRVNWKKVALRTIQIADVAVLVGCGYKCGKFVGERSVKIPVEGTVEETDDDIPEAEEEEA